MTLVRCASAFLLGWTAQAAPRTYSSYQKLDVFARVLAHVENNHVEEIDEDKLLQAAIRGMLGALDPHTQYLSPQENRAVRAETRGEFGGIGVEVEFRDGDLVVVAPLDGTPAATAGLKPGDRILKIDGAATRGMRMFDVVRRMRGPAGTEVSLTVARGAAETKDYLLKREIIRLVSVSGRLLNEDLGYVRIKSFQDRTDRYLQAEIERLQAEAKRPLGGLILDLRSNPGGLLDQAVRVADLFLSDGMIVRTVGRHGKVLDEERAHPRGTFADFPMAVVVDAGSASASEIVAGALQDHRRAVIVGTPTFGKGSVQTIIEFDDGSALKLTVARYLTPNGRSIQQGGITPDVSVEEAETEKPTRSSKPAREKDLDSALPGPPPQPALDLPEDPAIRRAVEVLRAHRILRHSKR